MRVRTGSGILAALLLSSAITSNVAFAAPPPMPIVGTMSAEVRGPDKRIDIPRTIDALSHMGINTYYYLIWENPNDWNDFPAFLDAAARQNIQVWAYVVPWSETPPHKEGGWGFSEPFKNDYVAWASEVAKLSLHHRNLVGYVIDDFYDNTEEDDHFTPKYVKEMTGAAKRINPEIKFFPLMYFQTPWMEFFNRFGTDIDGAVICYPKSEAGIRNALTYFNDHRHGPSVIMELPRHHGAEKGDGAQAYTDISLDNPDDAELSFYYDVTDQAESNDSMQEASVVVNNQEVWRSNTVGRMRDGVIDIDLHHFLRNRGRVHIEFQVVTKRAGVPDLLPVVVRFDDIRVYGAARGKTEFPTDVTFRRRDEGKFTITPMPGSNGGDKWHIPVVVMPSGEAEQFQKRYDSPGTPQSVAANVRMCMELLHQGLIQGVVPYRTPLTLNDPFYQSIRAEFARYRKSAEQTVEQR
jgi:hypothetical protein